MTPNLLSVVENGREFGALALGGRQEGAPVPAHAIVGRFALTGAGPDWNTFQRNAAFVAFYIRYMRGELPVRPRILTDARVGPGEKVYVTDGRAGDDPDAPVPWTDIIGWYDSEPNGAPAARTFVYNPEHALVSPAGKLSSIVFEDELGRAAATT